MSMSTITLSDAERMELSHRASSRAGRADDARRVRLNIAARVRGHLGHAPQQARLQSHKICRATRGKSHPKYGEQAHMPPIITRRARRAVTKSSCILLMLFAIEHR